jgi:hypothetical protein
MSAANTHVTFAEVDRSGDFRESLARVGGMTRAELLGAAGVTSAAMLAALAEPAEAWTGNDAEILQFDLQLEYLQSGMYQEALKIGKLSEQSREWARVIGAHELAHMKVIRSLLGSAAAKSGTFNYRGVTEDEDAFTKTAVAFEDLTGALLGWQAARIDSRKLRAAVFTLLTVETRHAAWVRHTLGLPPTSSAFDPARSQSAMEDLIASTNFVVEAPPVMRKSSQPRFTG